MSVPLPQMPFHRESTAPIFNPSQPRSLLCYFKGIEELFERCRIHDLGERKRWCLHYPPIEVADFWKLLPGWRQATDWQAVKSSVVACYPACSEEHRYQFADLVAMVDSQRSLEIQTINQWSTFLNQYLVISQYLLSRKQLDPLEQQRHLLRALSPSLRHEVEAYQYQVNPCYDQEDLATVEELDVVVQYCLRAAAAAPHLNLEPSSILEANSPPSNSLKTADQLSELVSKLVEELTKPKYRSYILHSPPLVITPAIAIAPTPASLTRKPAMPVEEDHVFASISTSEGPVKAVKVPLAAHRTLALSRVGYAPPHERNFGSAPPKVKKPVREKQNSVSATANPIYKQLLDATITIPLRKLIALRSRPVQVATSEDFKTVEPREQATMMKKIERELPIQEKPLVAVFPFVQVPEAPEP